MLSAPKLNGHKAVMEFVPRHYSSDSTAGWRFKWVLGVDEFSFEGLRKWSKLFLVPLENKLNNV